MHLNIYINTDFRIPFYNSLVCSDVISTLYSVTLVTENISRVPFSKQSFGREYIQISFVLNSVYIRVQSITL